MQNQKVIEQLGYSAKEAKVYLASLSLGEAHISDIATKVKLPRSTVQVIVDRLHEDGLMNFYVMRRYKYWVAEKPEQLLNNLKMREEAIEAVLPRLSAIRIAGKNSKKEEKHKKTLAIFSDFAETSHLPILIANSFKEIEYVNTAWQKEYGYTLDEVRGRNSRILQSGKTSQAVYERMWKEVSADRLFQSDEIIDRRKNGTLFKIQTTIFAVHNANRIFYIQILMNATEKKNIQILRKAFIESVTED